MQKPGPTAQEQRELTFGSAEGANFDEYYALSALLKLDGTSPGPLAQALTSRAFGALKQKRF
jgi:hypothetical protein